MPEIRSRISPSSSTTRISDAINDPFLLIFTSSLLLGLLREGECEGDFCSLPILGIAQTYLAAMVFHDLAHNRQSQPGAFGAGGDIGFGEPVPVFGRQAHAIIGDA